MAAPKVTPGEGNPGLAQKSRGVLLGTAVGDALGAPFEGSGPVRPDVLRRLEHRPGPLTYTDDTHMTLGLARSLVEREGFDGPHMAGLFARNYLAQPWRGYGPGPPRVFRLLDQGVPWDQASRALFGGGGSFGNGAAMRVAPVALLAFGNMERVASLARQTAVITHAHELGVEGAVLQACAVAVALGHDPATAVDPEEFLHWLRPHANTPVFQAALDRVEQLLKANGGAGLEAVIDQLGNGIKASESVPTAIYAFLRQPSSFGEVVTYAISLGGDTDTIACMAGALAGAHLGQDGIPALWAEGVEDAAELMGLADSLLSLTSAASAGRFGPGGEGGLAR